MTDVYFFNVTSEKSGAVLKAEGNLFYPSIMNQATFR